MRFIGDREVLNPGELNQARVDVARRHHLFHELDPVDLVERGPKGWLVSATTDAVYVPHPGVIWESGSTNLIADMLELYFIVPAGSGPVFVEKLPRTWTQQLERAHRKRVPA